jgi:hypothetical protein
MRKITIAIALSLLVSQAAYADETNTVYMKDSTGWLVPVDSPAPFVVAPGPVQVVSVPVPAKKPTFKEKHPRLYKIGRKTRTVCIFCRPLVDVGVSVGQLIVLVTGLL